MIRARVVAAVFRAELASVVRDRRTLLTSILVPVLLYPLAGAGLATVGARSFERVENERARVCFAGRPEDTGPIVAGLDEKSVEVVACPPGAQAGDGIAAVAVVPTGAGLALSRGNGVRVTVRYTSADFRGFRAKNRLEDALDARAQAIVRERLATAKLPAGFASPISIEKQDVTPPARTEMFSWAPALIVCLVFFSILGVFLPALDLTAGDRERLTLETLLTAPCSTSELIAGKYGVVAVMGFLSTVLNVGSLYATFSAVSSAAKTLHLSAPLSLTTAGLLVACTIPAVALSAAVCMAVGCLARSFRDAQNYLIPVYLAVFVPTYASVLPDAKLTLFTAAVPMLNLPLTMREILQGTLAPLPVIVGTAVDLAFTIAALLAAAALYAHEGLAFADAEPLDLLRRPSARREGGFGAGEAIALFAVALALVIYAGIPLQMHAGYTGVVLTEILLIAAPPILWAWWRRVDVREAFALRAPRWRGVAGAILFGLGAWVPIVLYARFVQEPVVPAPPGEEKAIRELLGVGQLALPWLLLIGAILPGLCEELLFRGAVLQGLRRSTGRWSIAITALFFATLHLDPWRLIPTFALGVLAGLVVWETGSVAAGMLFHLVHNGIAVVLSTMGSTTAAEPASVPHWLFVAGAACLPLATWVLFGPGAAASKEEPA